MILIDERADERQRAAIMTLVGGKVGGPCGVLAWTWPTIHGPKSVRYTIEQNGIHSSIKAGDCFQLESTTIKNPVTGAEVHPGVVLPEGIIVKHADLGASKVFHLDDAIAMDHSGGCGAV